MNSRAKKIVPIVVAVFVGIVFFLGAGFAGVISDTMYEQGGMERLENATEADQINEYIGFVFNGTIVGGIAGGITWLVTTAIVSCVAENKKESTSSSSDDQQSA